MGKESELVLHIIPVSLQQVLEAGMVAEEEGEESYACQRRPPRRGVDLFRLQTLRECSYPHGRFLG